MSSEPPTPAVPELESEREYVRGFPMYVAATIAASRPTAGFNALPYPMTHLLYGAIGLRVSRPGEAEPFVNSVPVAVVDPDLDTPTFRLRPGERRRLLLEISPLLPDDLAPGEYEAELLYGKRGQAPATSPRFPLGVRAPSREQQALLAALRPELEAAGSWGAWAEEAGPSKVVAGPAIDVRDPLRYPRALNHMLHGPGPLAAVDEDFLTSLDGLFAADAEGFRAEILAARDPHAFRAHAERVRTSWPGLAWWMDEIAAGESAIAWARTQR